LFQIHYSNGNAKLEYAKWDATIMNVLLYTLWNKGSLSPILAGIRRSEEQYKSISEANNAVWVYNGGNLSPSVLTESEQSEA